MSNNHHGCPALSQKDWSSHPSLSHSVTGRGLPWECCDFGLDYSQQQRQTLKGAGSLAINSSLKGKMCIHFLTYNIKCNLKYETVEIKHISNMTKYKHALSYLLKYFWKIFFSLKP